MPSPERPRHVYQVYIRTTPDKLWSALTEGDLTRKYFFGTAVASEWKKGAAVVFQGGEAEHLVEGTVLEVERNKRLSITWSSRWDETTVRDRPSRVTWELEPMGEIVRLTLTHDDFDGETATFDQVGPGWNVVLSGLKTLLETGRPLQIPM